MKTKALKWKWNQKRCFQDTQTWRACTTNGSDCGSLCSHNL